MVTLRSKYLFVHIIAFFVVMLISMVVAAQNKIPDDFCLSNNELNLFDAINQIRADYDKDPVELSASLSYVASLHVDDLYNNHPDTSICNTSSWSDQGDWTPCCHNSYVYDPDCMWEKPNELTPYRYRGYELVTFFGDYFNNDSIINIWADSREVIDMIITRGSYEKKKWVCGGLAIGTNYVSLWFGQRADSQDSPNICEDEVRDTTAMAIDSISKSDEYYLIFGSFNDSHSAKEALRKARNDNFVNANLIKENNRIRLYLNKFDNLKEAMYAKQQLQFNYRDAWILKD